MENETPKYLIFYFEVFFLVPFYFNQLNKIFDNKNNPANT